MTVTNSGRMLKGEPAFPIAEKALASLLIDKYGLLVGGADLCRLLGYRSGDAFRQAKRRHRLPVEVFSVPRRRGTYAYTLDVVSWLAALGVDSKEDVLREKGGLP